MLKSHVTYIGIACAIILLMVGFMLLPQEGPDNSAKFPTPAKAQRLSSVSNKSPSASIAPDENPASKKSQLVNFQSERDLYAFFEANKQSRNPAAAYQAYQAYVACQAMSANADRFRIAFGGGDHADIAGQLNEQRWAANQELLKRCAGFERLGQRKLSEEGENLRAHLHDLGSPEFSLDQKDQNPTLSPETLKQLLQTQSPSAFERAVPALAKLMRDNMGYAEGSPQADRLEIALSAAGCQLGSDCTNNAFQSLSECAYFDRCSATPGDDWKSNLSEDEIRAVLELKDRIVHQLQNGDYDFSKLRP